MERPVAPEDMWDTGAAIFVHDRDIGLTNSLMLVLKTWHKIKSDGDEHCTHNSVSICGGCVWGPRPAGLRPYSSAGLTKPVAFWVL